MQLLHEQTPLAMSMTMNSMSMSMKPSTDAFEVKEKSSNGSLMPMNPVASGDNVTTKHNSNHQLKEDLPALVPCCEGRELSISGDIVKTGLSAISMKHESGVMQCLSMSHAMDQFQFQPGLIKHRNSFRCLHRPDLKRVPYLRRMTPDELETLFRGYSGPGTTPTQIDKKEHIIFSQPPDDSVTGITTEKTASSQPNGMDITNLHPIPEARTASEDVPAGMRLHGARAKLYTSVLAAVKTGDHNNAPVLNDIECDINVSDLPPEDEVILTEELQIILPPRSDDIAADSCITATDIS